MMNNFTLDFIGIGVVKGGTTWLYRCLSEHPRVCMSVPKELNFFCTQHLFPRKETFYGKGEGWLKERFAHWQPGQLRGEISPSYMVDPQSPALIKKHFPDAKIIVSYRNPLECLYSYYSNVARSQTVPPTFEEFLEESPQRIANGFYHTHTMRYLELFPKDRFHFIVYDDIAARPQQVLQNLFLFLGVDSAFSPPSLHEKVNIRKAPKSALLHKLIVGSPALFCSGTAGMKIKALLKRIGVHRVYGWMLEKNLQGTTAPPLREETRKRLIRAYAEENKLLGEFLKRDLSRWNL